MWLFKSRWIVVIASLFVASVQYAVEAGSGLPISSHGRAVGESAGVSRCYEVNSEWIETLDEAPTGRTCSWSWSLSEALEENAGDVPPESIEDVNNRMTKREAAGTRP